MRLIHSRGSISLLRVLRRQRVIVMIYHDLLIKSWLPNPHVLSLKVEENERPFVCTLLALLLK